MAKKRTLKPFYGKINQRLESAAKAATKVGDMEKATALFEQSDKIVLMRSFRSRRTS